MIILFRKGKIDFIPSQYPFLTKELKIIKKNPQYFLSLIMYPVIPASMKVIIGIYTLLWMIDKLIIFTNKDIT